MISLQWCAGTLRSDAFSQAHQGGRVSGIVDGNFPYWPDTWCLGPFEALGSTQWIHLCFIWTENSNMKSSVPLTMQTAGGIEWNQDANTPPQSHRGMHLLNQVCITYFLPHIYCLCATKMFQNQTLGLNCHFISSLFYLLMSDFPFFNIIFQFLPFLFQFHIFCYVSISIFYFDTHGVSPIYFNGVDSFTRLKYQKHGKKKGRSIPWSRYLLFSHLVL